MFKIGDFSRLSRVPVKTLRYYAEIGLFKPAEVDRFTSYRYYTIEQLPRLNRLLALKDLGFSLEQIAKLLEEDLSVEQMYGMLRLRQIELADELAQTEIRMVRVAARLRQIEKEQTMSEYDVVIKSTDAQTVASLRRVIANYAAQGPLWGELMGYVQQHGGQPCGPGLCIYHDDGFKEEDVDVEIAVPITGALPSGDEVRVWQLPAAESVAALVLHGSFAQIGEAYEAIGTWIEQNGYTVAAPPREVYLQLPQSQDDANAVTEIQIPVKKI